ncbi:uncharacterized protein [Panulirus ornatus]|uniref:uncharacterized protein n=1 Tax=Panulirus ornatus TaxID=150431 RepID=UPI003A8A0E05
MLKAMKSGVFREIADAEKKRNKYVKSFELYSMLDSLVRRGEHVIVTGDQYGTTLISRDFSRKGRCDFYLSREGYMPAMSCMIGQKDSPLVPIMTKRIALINQAGLYEHWIKAYMPNSTSCTHPPTRIAVNTSFSVHNVWGMYVVLFGGHAISLLVLGLELVSVTLHQRMTS